MPWSCGMHIKRSLLRLGEKVFVVYGGGCGVGVCPSWGSAIHVHACLYDARGEERTERREVVRLWSVTGSAYQG